MKKEINRNPSFTPSPKLREYLYNSEHGVTHALKQLFDNYRIMLDLDAIRLTADQQFALKEHLLDVFIDPQAIQCIP